MEIFKAEDSVNSDLPTEFNAQFNVSSLVIKHSDTAIDFPSEPKKYTDSQILTL